MFSYIIDGVICIRNKSDIVEEYNKKTYTFLSNHAEMLVVMLDLAFCFRRYDVRVQNENRDYTE